MKQYNPHKFQKEFHNSTARIRVHFTGRQNGKSTEGTIESAWWADVKAQMLGRATKGWVLAPTYKMLIDNNIPKFFEWLPQSSIKDWNKSEHRITLINGSEITFRSTEDPDKLRGITLDWLWLDEACFMKPEVWAIIEPTLIVNHGNAWITTTPQGYDWVYATFYKNAGAICSVAKPLEETKQSPVWTINPQGDSDIAVFHNRTIDSDHIDPVLVQKAKKTMSDQMFRQEYLATFEKFTGLVYQDFSEERHVCDIKPERDWTYFVGIDVGFTNPTASVLMAEDKSHNLYVLDEVYETQKTVPEIAELIRGMIARNGLVEDEIELMVIDPSSKGRDQTSGMSVFTQLQETGLLISDGNNDVIAGINRMTQLIRTDKFKVAKRCVNFIKEILSYSWKENKDGTSNRDERPVKTNDHLMDCTRYVVMSRPEYFEHPRFDEFGVKIGQQYREEVELTPNYVEI